MNLFFASFLILPILALLAKESGKLKLPLWSIFLVCAVVGWLLVNLAVEQYFASLDEVISSSPNPPEELLERRQNDGAKRVFALYFGWAYAALYFLICLWIIKAARALVRRG